MKALYIWDYEYPWDIRVEKTCETLIENGWEMHLVCRNSLRRPKEEIYEGIHLHRLPFLPKFFGKLNHLYTFPAFFSPLWLWRINEVIKKDNLELIIVRDLPLALAAIMIGKLRKIPVILDMAECYPEMIRLIWKYEPFKLSNIFVRNPVVVDLIERITLKHIDHVFVMVEESKARLIDKKVPEEKITIVSNTPILRKFQNVSPTYPGSLAKHKDKLKLIYVGILDFNRGLDTVISALKEYVKLDKNVVLLILGKGNCEDYLNKLVNEEGVEEYVEFEGWVDNKKVPDYIASSDVCLVPHHKCGHWDNTIPNKLFDYMASSKAVLISNVTPMQRIVHKTNCGLVYTDYDSKSFSEQLLQLRSSELRQQLGRNGRKAVDEYYNWDTDSTNMLSSLEKYSKPEKSG